MATDSAENAVHQCAACKAVLSRFATIGVYHPLHDAFRCHWLKHIFFLVHVQPQSVDVYCPRDMAWQVWRMMCVRIGAGIFRLGEFFVAGDELLYRCSYPGDEE